MTIQQNRPVVPIPNVHSNQTEPNVLGGQRRPSVRPRRPLVPVRRIAMAAAVALALAWLLFERSS